MASDLTLPDRIIALFIEKKTLQLRDYEIADALNEQGVDCDRLSVRGEIQILSPILFRFQSDVDGSSMIHVDPQIRICEDYWNKFCSKPNRTCEELHICRHFDRCLKADCRRAHDLNSGFNRTSVMKRQCQRLNANLLLKLFAFKQNLILPQERRALNLNTRPPVAFNIHRTRLGNRTSTQVDLVFDRNLNLAEIKRILKTQGIVVESESRIDENDYFRRVTVQLKYSQDVIDIHSLPNSQFKCKQMTQTIDPFALLLIAKRSSVEDRIELNRVRVYVDCLVGRERSALVTDRTSHDQHVFLVQCQQEIDNNKAEQWYKQKPQLAGKDLKIVQIYTIDSLQIRCNSRSKPLTVEILREIFHSVWAHVFCYDFPEESSAKVEFINGTTLREWMPSINDAQRNFDVKIDPIIKEVEEKNDQQQNDLPQQPLKRCASDTSLRRSSLSNLPRETTVILPPDWQLILNHRKYLAEFQDIIRDRFSVQIEIRDNQLIYPAVLPCDRFSPKLSDVLHVVLKEYANKFSYNCKCLDSAQVNFLRENEDRIVYRCLDQNKYRVIVKLNEHAELIGRLESNLHPEKPKTAGIISSNYPISDPKHVLMFSNEAFKSHLETYLRTSYHVETIVEEQNVNGKKTILIRIQGVAKSVHKVREDLSQLFLSLQTKQIGQQWAKIPDSIDVLQYQLKKSSHVCVCQRISPALIDIHFFDNVNMKFGLRPQILDDFIENQFTSRLISYQDEVQAKNFSFNRQKFEDQLRGANDYGTSLCFTSEPKMIHLFGLKEQLEKVAKELEALKGKSSLQSSPIDLSDDQLKFLSHFAKNEMNALIETYRSVECELSVDYLRRHRAFLAPVHLHRTIADQIVSLAQIQKFDIDEPGFEVLVNQDVDRLTNIVKNKCYLEKKIETVRIHIEIPLAKKTELPCREKSSSTATANRTPKSVTIGHSKVIVAFGDLTSQTVDGIVLCSSSMHLCQAVYFKAGPQLQKEYEQLRTSNRFPAETTGGQLLCKKIFLIPWSPVSREANDLKESLSNFISTAMDFARNNKYRTIALPAVGCGGFGVAPNIIAEYIFRELRKQILQTRHKMNISFVLVREQTDVYDAFVKELNDLQQIDPNVNNSPPTKQPDKTKLLPYDKKIIKMTLISSRENHLTECRQEILNLARSFSATVTLNNQQDMLDWSQETIENYYRSCLDSYVLPKMDLEKLTLELSGPKDHVHQAERKFYELNSEVLRKCRTEALARNVVWWIETVPHSNRWEQYSYRLNGIIENAFFRKMNEVTFTNENSEQCTVVFSTSEEIRAEGRFRIRRTTVDSLLPITWEPSDINCKRVLLLPSSAEYRTVISYFDETMQDRYSQIIRIERIQNERWYKQYIAHREEFRRRDTYAPDRLLFHGCPKASADKIIQQCFDRNFAGVNGVAYGRGVYFHTQASYSDQYAKVDDSGEKTIFLVRVLIGKSCRGDKTMIAPPAGYDTTTDGENIFVVYHDAGAYAEHLVTYR